MTMVYLDKKSLAAINEIRDKMIRDWPSIWKDRTDISLSKAVMYMAEGRHLEGKA